MDSDRLNEVLTTYETYPMEDGDVVLLLVQEDLATEIEGLADAWDPTLRRNIVKVVRELEAREVLVGIARRYRALGEGDHRVVTELRQELAGTGVLVHPAVALPASA